MTDTDVRCSAASLEAQEPMVGTAPTETTWLLLEAAMPWGAQALAESRLPPAVRERLLRLTDVRIQLIRRHGAESSTGVRVFAATASGDGFAVEGARLGAVTDLLDLPLESLATAGGLGLPAYDGPLWLVCTNGRRDRCCAELGRPVTAALAARWPEATWETTHLGGHRFAATLVALPSGVTLGRLDVAGAVASCTGLAEGRLPLDLLRGRAGLPAIAQAAELHVRELLGLDALGAVRVDAVDGADVLVTAGLSDDDDTGSQVRGFRVTVDEVAQPPRALSCGDAKAKPTSRPVVTGVREALS